MLAGGWFPATAHSATPPSCRELSFPVSVVGLAETVSGQLCVPAGGANTVQVLVPGGTYNSTYWDSPYTPDIRSFRLAMNHAGYATLIVDQLGTGGSSRPPSAVVTAAVQADAVHQVIQAVHTGTGVPSFAHVILGGHSVGSGVVIIEAGTYHDEDAVLITGLTHGLNPNGAAAIIATLIPADLDPKFAGQGYDPGYLTTRAGTRYNSFQAPGAFDQGAVDLDESTKDVIPSSEVIDTALLGVLTPYSQLIDVPVLVVVATEDPVFCGLLAANCSTAQTLYDSEAPFYSTAADLSTFVLPNFGHSINYAPNSPDYQAAVVTWANAIVGS